MLETYRECLQDVFDLPALKRLLHGLRTRELDLVEVETRVGVAVRVVAPLRLHRDVHVRGRHAAGRAARAGALARPRPAARAARPGGAARADRRRRARRGRGVAAAARRRTPIELHDVLRLRGDLRVGEFDEAHAAILEAERRAIRVRIAGEERLIAAEDAGRYRDALGVMPPAGLPDVVPRGRRRTRCAQLVARYARGRGPFTTGAGERAGSASTSSRTCASSSATEKLVRGELRPGGTEREWCDPDVLRRLRRASLAALRREVEPAEQAALGRFLPSWHGIDRRATLREALIPLQGLALPVSLWESRGAAAARAGLPAGAARPALRVRRARLGRRRARPRRRVLPRGRAAARRARRRAARRRARRTTRSAPRSRGGAQFWFDLLAATGLEAEVALPALWDLVWAGEVTNDAWHAAARRAPLPTPRARAARAPLLARARRAADGDAGPLVARGAALRRRRARPARARRAPARAAGHRHARRRARRGDPRRLRRGLRRAACARDARHLPARLLRRGPRRRAVRARRRGRAAARAAAARRRRAGAARARRGRSGAAVRRRAAVAEARAARAPRASRARTSSCSAARPRSSSSAAAARSSRCASPRRSGCAPALAALVAHVKRGGAKRLAVERFDGEPVAETRRRCRCSSRPASSPARAAPSSARTARTRRSPVRTGPAARLCGRAIRSCLITA